MVQVVKFPAVPQCVRNLTPDLESHVILISFKSRLLNVKKVNVQDTSET